MGILNRIQAIHNSPSESSGWRQVARVPDAGQFSGDPGTRFGRKKGRIHQIPLYLKLTCSNHTVPLTPEEPRITATARDGIINCFSIFLIIKLNFNFLPSKNFRCLLLKKFLSKNCGAFMHVFLWDCLHLQSCLP